MKRNLVIMMVVALATMVMVGCKPLTGSTVCTHDWDLTDDVAPTCAANGVKTYTCTLCGDKQYEPIPATGNHTWVDTDDTKVTSAKYYEVSEGVYNFEKVEVSPKYKCSICGEEHDKTIAFFTTDDHKTTIGVATGVNCNDWKKPELPLDTWTVEKYNSYYDEVVMNKGKSGYISYCNCKCIHDVAKENTCSCVDDCTCGDPDNCVRSSGNYVFFGSYYIKY
ncbi:MAG: hypothetical protein MJ176_10670 [Treponema sp.]|nr:hypothetical protein [Treponema sp.]